MMRTGWALYSHAAKAWIDARGKPVPTVQEAAPITGAAAWRVAEMYPGDMEANRVYLNQHVNH